MVGKGMHEIVIIPQWVEVPVEVTVPIKRGDRIYYETEIRWQSEPNPASFVPFPLLGGGLLELGIGWKLHRITHRE